MQRHPPTASKLSGLFATIAKVSMRIPQSRACLLVAVALLATIALDLARGPQVNVIILYLAIACFGSWCLSDKVELTIGAISVAMLGEVNGFGASDRVSHITQSPRAAELKSQ